MAWIPLALLHSPADCGLALIEAIATVVLTMAVMYHVGLYRSSVCARRSSETARVAVAVTIGATTFAGLQWISGPVTAAPLLEGAAAAAAAVLLLRWRFVRWLKGRRSDGQFLRTVVLVGTNDAALALWNILISEPELGYRVGAVAGDERMDAPWHDLPTRTNLAEVGALARQANANGLMLVPGALDSDATAAVIDHALTAGLHVQVWPGLTGLASGRLRLSPLSDVPALYVDPRRTPRWQLWAKRVMDIVFAMLIVLLAAPLMLLVSALIKLADGGPVFNRGERVGRSDARITVLKFRTMVPNAEHMLADVASLNERTGGPLFKATNDPRVTKVGRFLRATSIDELPQLWNVLSGTMSLVGPRPALPAEVERFDTELRRRHEMRPGVTGLWQVEARDNPSFSAYRRLDLAYVDNWTLGLDLSILATTVHAVLSRAARTFVDAGARRKRA